jgi:xanthine dehydrogenase YagT iron-sulfur-binding subunit
MKKPKRVRERRTGLSRRRFVNSMGAGAAGTALLTVPGQAGQPAATAPGIDAVKAVLNVNGRVHTLSVEPRWTLLHVLREQLGLMGTKAACERGECGSCTVLIDGVARYSCMTLAVEASGAQITTIEGLMKGEELGPVQQAFVEEDAFQCGFCTSGQIVSVEALLRKTPQPTIEQIREGVSGTLCRCGTYVHNFRAAQRAAELKRGR